MIELVCTATRPSPGCVKSTTVHDWRLVKGLPVVEWFNSRGRLCTPCYNASIAGMVRRNGHDTEVAAALSQKLTGAPLRQRLLAEFIKAGNDGLTDYEAGLKGFAETNRIRTRRKELTEKFGQNIINSGRQRPTNTNHLAIVWVLVQ